MMLQKMMEVPISRKGKNFIVKGAWAIPIVLGTTSVSGNMRLYKVKKEGDSYVVPIEVVEERVKLLEDRIKDLNCKIGLMKQVLKSK